MFLPKFFGGLTVVRLRVLAAWLTAAIALATASVPARADDPAFLTFQGGGWDVIQQHKVAAAWALEYRDDTKLWIFKPFGGMMFNSNAGIDAYAGILLDVYLGRRIVAQLGFAPSIYYRGTGVDLGYPLEFRSSGEIAYRFDDRSRLGAQIYHLSNAGLGWTNPGTEVVMLSYSVPVTRFLGGSK